MLHLRRSIDQGHNSASQVWRAIGAFWGGWIGDRVGKSSRRFVVDERGSYAIIAAILMPVVVGGVGLGIDIGVWYKTKQAMQGASDSAAASAAAAYAASPSSDLTQQATAVASGYGFVNGAAGVSLTLNHPPSSGSYTNNANAIEVIIQQSQPRYFSAIFSSEQVPVSTRSVAIADAGLACVLALDPSASGAITSQGNPTVSLNNCSLFSDSSSGSAVNVGGAASVSALSAGAVGGISGSITTTEGVTTGDSTVVDPFAGVSFPAFSGCDAINFSAKSTVTIGPVPPQTEQVYCGGMQLNAGADVTLRPGIYYMDQGSLTVNGSATLTGAGVTIVFTSSTGQNYATATINGGANVDLTPPAPPAPTAGIVLFGDRNMPVGTTFNLNGGASQILTGATYLPTAAVTFAGGNDGASGCAQLIGDTVTFTGNSNFSVSCPNAAHVPIGSSSTKLVE